MSTPNGWTRHSKIDTGPGTMYVYYSTTTSNSSVDLDAGFKQSHLSIIFALRGTNTDEPIADAGFVDLKSSQNYKLPGVTTPVKDCLVLRVVAGHDGTGQSYIWDAGVEIYDSDFYNSSIAAAYETVPNPTTFSDTSRGITPAKGGAYHGCSLVIAPLSLSRMHLGSTPVPLMLGNTEVEILGP
ncbi:hypothetical protein [Rhodococcus marinonascens]|uniref:hypothetical protein n=1 Tax=Rhodococcus marinonascens TaxID=38311 RepID=UPI0011147DA3|nr:hypothetical protein [Rhodococcus marinonascens]